MPLAFGNAAATTLPAGFQESIVLTGLSDPTALALSPDGRMFIAEKSGRIKVFDGPGDTTATIFADLRTNVHNFWDRGLSGIVLHPNFPQTPYVYVTYTLDAPIGGTPPVWGVAGMTSDHCPTPPGPTDDGCVVGGRVSRLEASGDAMVGPEVVLVEAWCQQFPSHTNDSVIFGADGALYVSAGDGGSFLGADYGQFGTFKNPCGDPPGGVGALLTPPTAQGGALRAQSPRRGGGASAVYNGSVLRIDPITGAALPDNPFVSSGIPNADRIVAYGLRNPFRMTARPGTSEIWVGDVGWNGWDEINRIADGGDAAVENFGWPCYEGLAPQNAYRSAQLDQCRTLYEQAGTVTAPVYSYRTNQSIVAGDGCGTGANTVSGLAFYTGDTFPPIYGGALFLADYSRNCMWAMLAGPDGAPDPEQRVGFASEAGTPVDLKVGADGALYVVIFAAGQVRRIQYFGDGEPPIAVADSDVSNGALPLTVQFDASDSSDPDSDDPLAYEWDLDGDGQFDDSTAVAPQFTYTQAATVTVRVRVTDTQDLASIAAVVITAGNTAPVATITAPLASLQWQVGTLITFSGTAGDAEDGTISGSRMSWTVVMHHCSTAESCHQHPVQDFINVSGGSFVAPNHEYPSFLEIRMTARDAGGLTDTTSVMVHPRTVALSFTSLPPGLMLAVGSDSLTTPFTRTVIVGSSNTVSAPAPQPLGGASYGFVDWSDGGAASHIVVAGSLPASFTASFACESGCGPQTPTPTVTPSHLMSGALRYYTGGQPVAGVQVALQGGGPTAPSSAAGQYAFPAVLPGNWQLVPRKAGDHRRAVSALDAAYIMQLLGGRRTLGAAQLLAADVTGDGVVNIIDVVRIMQLSVGAPAPLNAALLCGSDWLFMPAAAVVPNQTIVSPSYGGGVCVNGSIGYMPLAGNATGQDFSALLIGDVTGNWQPGP